MSAAWPPELIDACARAQRVVADKYPKMQRSVVLAVLDAAVAWRDEHGNPAIVRADWAGVMAVLDAVYPAEVFDGSSGDPGPRIVVLMRRVEALTQALRAVLDGIDKGVSGQELCRRRDAARAVLAAGGSERPHMTHVDYDDE